MPATTIPSPGFGTYDLRGEAGVRAVRTALEIGYRHVDTARMYENEAVVGEAIARADVDRDDVFVATKVGHFTEPDLTPGYIRTAVEESCERLGVETIDLLYVHWPYSYDAEEHLPVLDDLVEAGAVCHLGMSNFTPELLNATQDLSESPILAIQVEMHPLLHQRDLHEYVLENDLYLVAYSPLAQGEVFGISELSEIAAKHGISEAQVTLAWLDAKERVVPIPKASSEVHVQENFAAAAVELDSEDIETIEEIERTRRLEDEGFMDW